MTGVQLAEQVRTLLPGAPVVLMSGYVGDARRDDVQAASDAFLGEPFTPGQLESTIASLVAAAVRPS
jgi:CheY-like chemotaxis protein